MPKTVNYVGMKLCELVGIDPIYVQTIEAKIKSSSKDMADMMEIDIRLNADMWPDSDALDKFIEEMKTEEGRKHMTVILVMPPIKPLGSAEATS